MSVIKTDTRRFNNALRGLPDFKDSWATLQLQTQIKDSTDKAIMGWVKATLEGQPEWDPISFVATVEKEDIPNSVVGKNEIRNWLKRELDSTN